MIKSKTDCPPKTTVCPKRLDGAANTGYTGIRNIGGEARRVKVELKIEPGRREPEIVILAGAASEELDRLVRELSGLALAPVPVWQGDKACLIQQGDFLRFFADGKGVSAQTAEGCYSVRLRLYELEERLDPRRFVRISNSEIVNLDKVTAVDLSLTGTIRMTLNGTVSAYVSRRYVKKIKETLNLGRRDRT